ncbi:MAG: hypothetical protein IIC67_05610 [Thaumarchaeota archaeon]|nr:hypothetical protein [Nitrososphaerota archaeon]
MTDIIPVTKEDEKESFFDPTKARERVLTEFKKRAESSKFLPEILKRSAETIISANEAFTKRMIQLEKQSEVEFDKADTALNRLENIAQNPPIINSILSLFDPDFSAEAQRKRVERARLGLSRIQGQEQRAAQFRSLSVASVDQLRQAAKDFYTINREGFVDAIELARFGFSIPPLTRKQTLNKVVDASSAELQQWLDNPQKAPDDLQNREGLIEIELIRRKATEVNVEIQELALNRQQSAFAVRSFINKFPDIESARKALLEPNKLPENVAPGALRDEINRVEGIEITLETHQLALQANNLKLIEAMKQQLFKQLSFMDVQQLLASSQTGTITLGNFKFSRAEIKTLLATKQKQEAEENKIFTDAVIASTSLQTNKFIVDDRAQVLATVLNPELADPGHADLPGDIQIQILDTEAKVNSLDPLKAQPGVAAETSAILQAQIEILDKRIEDTITNNYTKEQQPAVREFAEKRRIDNAENAARYLVSNVGNPNLLDSSFELGPAWRAFSTSFIKPFDTTSLAGLSPDEFQQALISQVFGEEQRGKRPPAVTIQQAAKDSNAVNIYASMTFQSLLRDTLGVMIKQSPQPSPKEELRFLEQFINPRTTNLASNFFKQDENGQRIFSPALFIEITTRATMVAQQSGLLGADENITSEILDNMRAGLPTKMNQIFSNSLNAAAFNTAILGNRPGQPIIDEIAATEAQIPIAVRNALGLSAELERAVQLPAMTGGPAGLALPLPGIGRQ